MATRVTFTARETTRIINLYKNGAGSKDIAERFNVSSGTILRVLQDEGVKIRSRGRPRVS